MSSSSDLIQLTIDGRAVSARAGQTIWEAARDAGIDVPVLCHEPRMTPVGVCRMCVVDVGGRVLAASCVRACEQGMQVSTKSPKVEAQRAMLTRLLLADHPTPCAKEQTTADCDLEALGRRYHITDPQLPRGNGRHTDHSSHVISVDHQACILCDRCVRGCDELQSNEVITRSGKGYGATIAFDLNLPMGSSTCVSCGECAAVCPTGALTHKPLATALKPRAQLQQVDSTCPYCGVGCALTLWVDRDVNKVALVDGRKEGHNLGRLCVKGRYGFDYASHPQRLSKPLIRRPEFYPKGALSRDVKGEHDLGKKHRPGAVVDYAEVMPAFREATWDEALDLIATRFQSIKAQHGPQALAGFGSAKCSNEEAYLFQKLIRAVFGTNNVDHCTRLCHASSVAALLETIGSGAVTNVFHDVKRADVALLIGTNTTVNHPVAATFLKAAAKGGTKLVVVDPRRPDVADHAWKYLRQRPSTDVALLNGMINVIIAEKLYDPKFVAERTTGFEDLSQSIARYTPEVTAQITGVPADDIRLVARTFAKAKAAIVFWGMGISQHTHGTDNARALIALCLLCGHVGRPGTGLHPLRGQNNVQGASDAGLIPMMYPDYAPVKDPEHRARFEKAWGVPLDPKPGLTVVEIMRAALNHEVRGMYMMGENPFMSDPNINKVRKALASLDFLVSQEIFLTETAEFADVILPATSFFEKTGTYTNTDRRVQIGHAALRPPGEARLDWEIVCEIARRMGYDQMQYASIEEVFEELASLSPSLDGLHYDNLGGPGRLWPLDQEILFDHDFPSKDGKGKLVPTTFAPAAELPDADYPMVLITGRVLEHWHTGSMTRRAQALDALEPEPFIELNPTDATHFGIAEGDFVRARSRRGEIMVRARLSTASAAGSCFMPFHFREAAANVLTIDELDPYGKIPEFKFCAIHIERA
jgi:formate dehydrogenase major subunit